MLSNADSRRKLAPPAPSAPNLKLNLKKTVGRSDKRASTTTLKRKLETLSTRRTKGRARGSIGMVEVELLVLKLKRRLLKFLRHAFEAVQCLDFGGNPC
jgi:hypothetical protein